MPTSIAKRRRLGAAAVFEKPLPLEVLEHTIDRLVSGRADVTLRSKLGESNET